MNRKEDTPIRVKRRKYEESHKEERKQKCKVWGTSIERQYAEEIDEFLKRHRITKVDLIVAGYEVLRNQYDPKETE